MKENTSEPLFMLGDVIEIANADRPEWCAGIWSVAEVWPNGDVRLTPLNSDKTVDVARDSRRTYWITKGGFVDHARREATT